MITCNRQNTFNKNIIQIIQRVQWNTHILLVYIIVADQYINASTINAVCTVIFKKKQTVFSNCYFSAHDPQTSRTYGMISQREDAAWLKEIAVLDLAPIPPSIFTKRKQIHPTAQSHSRRRCLLADVAKLKSSGKI
ncbi:Hypothetical_protein [Hexamita inflata]|uniref:Hypothetical_protein n=1 Tax=Hexamita inflata TaxID=28002 RepID=A0AA86UK75_9EUKA|nr:Hypothetical protein HINF_LOCUS46649 [Hexamita inflata]